ncbi:MAG: FliH/SctL family protein [Terriglobia bacterium]
MPWSSKARIMALDAGQQKGVEGFHYPAAPEAKNSAGELRPGIELLFSEPPAAAPAPDITDKDLEERARQGFEAGREKGMAEGQAQARAEFEKALTAERAKVARALQEFTNEQDAYYRKVEPEVVRLALGIARKVLNRECQIDPLALTGIVRVTLEKLAAAGQVKLRVPAPQAAGWRNAFKPQDFPDLQFEIVPEDLLEGPQCRIETEGGATDLSINTQLDEIERGFLDLMEHRPGN